MQEADSTMDGPPRAGEVATPLRSLSGVFQAVGPTAPTAGDLARALLDTGAGVPDETLGAVLGQLLADTVALVDADAVSVRSYDAERDALVLRAVHGPREAGQAPDVAQRGEVPCGLALEHRTPIVTDDLPAAEGAAAFRSAFVVPVPDPAGQVLGCVTLYRRHAWLPSPRERHALDVLVRAASGALERARLAEAARQELAERERAEAALRVADMRFRRLVDAGVIGVAIASPDGVHEANDEYLRHAGATRADLEAGRIDWRAITPDEHIPRDFAALQELIDTGAATPFEKEYVHRDGSRFPILLGATELSREPLTWLAFTLDLTRQRAAERALAERASDWEMLFELAPVPMLIAHDAACTRMHANSAYQALTGLMHKEHASVTDPVPPPYRVLHRGRPCPIDALPMQRAAATGEHIEDHDYELVLADGRHIQLASYARPRRGMDGAIRGALGAFIDVTNRRRREDANRLLSEIGQALATTLDLDATVERVVRLVLPTLADWCVCDLVEGTGEDGALVMRRAAVAHADPAREAAAEALKAFPPGPNAHNVVYEVTISGEPRLLQRVSEEVVQRGVRSAAHAEASLALDPASLAVLPLRANGQVRGALSFVRGRERAPFTEADLPVLGEIASRASLALANAMLYRQAQEAARTKGDFLAVMSHELRTPLQAILGYAGLLADEITGPVEPAQQQQLGRIRAAANHLLALIDEVLTLARLDAGREVLHAEPVDVARLAREVAEMVEPTVAMKGLAFEVEIAEEPLSLTTDAVRVRQVLLNLLSNATKFTERGRVRLHLARTRDGVAFTVEDTGIGLDAQQRARVFDSFWRAEPTMTRRTPGAGLGLAISQRLVRLMGGRIEVESTPGVGSRFTVWLPRAVPADVDSR